MGNCLKHQSSSANTWAGDDWGSPLPEMAPAPTRRSWKRSRSDVINVEEEEEEEEEEHDSLLHEKHTINNSSVEAVGTEVKIMITKKQLEELIGSVDIQGLRLEQVLTKLIHVSDQYDAQHHRSWKPALQSIPEVN